MTAPRPARRRRHRLQRLAGAVLAVVLLLAGGTIAWAWSTTTSNPGTSVTGALLTAPANPSASKVADCTSVNLSWTAVTGADRYRIERRTANGTFATLEASYTTTSYPDNTSFTHRTLTYRITPFVSGSSWVGPPATVTVICGIGEVSDVAVTNPCSRNVVTWSAAGGSASGYDIYRTVNGAGGGSPVSINQAGTSYSDTTQHALGATVAYWVVPRNGGTISPNQSNVATVASWQPFAITSLTFLDVAGTPSGSLNADDTVSIQFNKPANTSTLTSSTIFVQRTGSSRGVYVASSDSTSGNTQAAYVTTGNIWGAAGAFAGTVQWSNGNATWTWTSTGGGTTMTGNLSSGAFALGDLAGRVQCAGHPDRATTLPTTTYSGQW